MVDERTAGLLAYERQQGRCLACGAPLIPSLLRVQEGGYPPFHADGEYLELVRLLCCECWPDCRHLEQELASLGRP